MEYLFIGFILLFLSTLEIAKRNRFYSSFALVFCSIVMVLFVGLRNGTLVGTDSPAYYENYTHKLWTVEYGYRYLSWLFASNDIHYNIFLIFINAVSLYNITRFIKFNSPYYLFPLLVYFSDFFLYYNFSGIRQALALSFASLSINYILQDKKIKAAGFIIIGALFHITTLIFLICFIIPKTKMTLRSYAKMIIMIFFGMFIINYLIENVEYLRVKFMYYSELQEKPENIFIAYIIGILKRSIVFIGIFLAGKKFFNESRTLFLFNIYLVGFAIYIGTYLFSPDFGVRFSTYFIMMDCVLIGNILWVCRKSTLIVKLYLMFVTMVLYKIYTYTQVETYEYSFFLD